MCTLEPDTKEAKEHKETSIKEDEVLGTQNPVGVALRPGPDKEKNMTEETRDVQIQENGDDNFETIGPAPEAGEKMECFVPPASSTGDDIAQDQSRRSESPSSATDNEAGEEHGKLIRTRRMSFRRSHWCKGFTNRSILCFILAIFFLAAAWIMVVIRLSEISVSARSTGGTSAHFSCGGAVSAHKALFPGAAGNTSSSLKLSSFTFDPLNDDLGTEHACSIVISKNSFVIIEPGEYWVYLSLQIDMNVTFPVEKKIQAFVFLDRPYRPSNSGLIFKVSHIVCANCQDKKTLYSGGSVHLQAEDRLVVRGPGPKVIDFSKTSSFLGTTKLDPSPHGSVTAK